MRNKIQFDIETATDSRLKELLKGDSKEILNLAKDTGAYWSYDYERAGAGELGLHAELKSGRHSDGYFDSRILLKPENVGQAIAQLMIEKLQEQTYQTPEYVVGVPNGATKLGRLIANILGSREVEMEKIGGQIDLVSSISADSKVLVVEDFCTRGTGFKETVRALKNQLPTAVIAPFAPVIVKRGGLDKIVVERIDDFTILPLAEVRINDWKADKCPLCQKGSKAIKPKAAKENWLKLTTSQTT